MERIVVIGAGQAGASLALKLRVGGFTGAITLLGGEPDPPYQRPPLSKGYLLGEMTRERLLLKPAEAYAAAGIELRTGIEVTAIDRTAREVVCADGTRIGYDALALTLGATPRPLPAAVTGGRAGVFTIRTLADIDALAESVAPGQRALVVGGGYIGLEAAAVARKLGLDVTLVEMADRLLSRVASVETAAWFAALHRAEGVDLRLGTGLAHLTGTGRVTGAVLSDGTEIAADVVIAGIGVTPNTALAKAAGLALDNGIAVDATGRTSDPAIWAAGDCASFPWRGARIRLESVQNAIDQAESVAVNMLGEMSDYDPVPWFWSDQYGVKLQIAGLGTGHDFVAVRAGAREGTVSHWYFREGALIAVDAMNDPRAYMVGKRMIEAQARPDPRLIADPAADLKALMTAA